ncbi:MAG: ABC transporter ATP-binding protein [Candidatus Methanomethylicota archaeon]|uniref:ABC transporter ATP-binding protein n=1 Tax=Thermoproteota archaeon TaxID=2056631 RepID=A0A497ELQ8_9CREN|nr:MAG: ABC transporter ATP-binding protein [Candidatus Verstraetearchaeota archaeon]
MNTRALSSGTGGVFKTIEVIDLWYTYPNGVQALRGVNLKIERGAFIAILGENGAGKTTLIRHFNGLIKPQRGCVLIDGEDTREKSVAELARKVGLVFQNPENQLFAETVEKEIAFALKNFRFPEDEIKRRVEWALNEFNLAQYRNKPPFMLSGGEKKRLALASILCYDPEVIVLDEPTTGQDEKQKEKLAQMLYSLNKRGKTVIVVTHDVEFVADYINDVVVLSQGRVLARGKTLEIFSNFEVLKASNLLQPQAAKIALSLRNLGISVNSLDISEIKDCVLKAVGVIK